MEKNFSASINSEIGKLEAVVLHRPGPEVENMTPGNAERALYSDILNLSIARREFDQLKGVLDKVCTTFETTDLLTDILKDDLVKDELVRQICTNERLPFAIDHLLDIEPAELARQMTEGVLLEKDNLTRYLSKERYMIRPMHNLFFTRDAAMGMNQQMVIGSMAKGIRERESLIMAAIFKNHPRLKSKILIPGAMAGSQGFQVKPTIEGGDFLVARPDVFIIGVGSRTNSQGIDFILETLRTGTPEPRHIIVQELPHSPESFIHLDMVFTILDHDACMVYEPIVFELNRYRTIHLETSGGKVTQISKEANVLECLNKLGIDLEPVICGGKNDPWVQEREQWHSGANFFAFAPGKVLGYERNVHTLDEMDRHGFEIIPAIDVIAGKKSPDDYKRCVVTIAGSELARGGGGARCMTLPVARS